MSGFVMQMAGAALVFALIEGLESLIRRRWPGKARLRYSMMKIGYGLPIVLLAGALLPATVDWLAVGLGVAIAAALALALFGAADDREHTR